MLVYHIKKDGDGSFQFYWQYIFTVNTYTRQVTYASTLCTDYPKTIK